MVDYSLELVPVFNSTISDRKLKVLQHKSEYYLKEDIEKLIAEVLDKYKEEVKSKFNTETFVIGDIVPTYLYLEKDSDHQELKEESRALWEALYSSEEFQNHQLNAEYANTLQHVKDTIQKATALSKLDSQEYLNFLDELNKLSVSH